jgi:hypothetical protein
MLTIEALREAVRTIEALRESTGFEWSLAQGSAHYRLDLDGAIAELWCVSESSGSIHWEARIGPPEEEASDLSSGAGSSPAEAWAACVGSLRRCWCAWLATQATEAQRKTRYAPIHCRLCGVELAPVPLAENTPPICLGCARLVQAAMGEFLPEVEEDQE